MARGEHETDVNLEELRQRLAGHAALVLMAASGVMMWLNWYRSLTQAFPHGPFFSAAAMFALCWWVRRLMTGHPAWARRLLVWCLTAALLAALVLVPAPWLPFLGLPLAFVAAMLVQGAGFVSGGLVAVLAAWLTRHGLRTYPSPEVYIVLGMCVVLAWLVTRTFYTALSWAWTTRQRADELLELARDRQAELNRALKSLDLSNSLLRRTQHELVAARRQAEQARLMKEQFAANVSHELRTPLGLILGFSELMYLSSEVYGDMEWPPTLRRDVYQIYRSSRHLLDMINDILDLSRFEMVG
ncbi:MAG: histidine kinase dimerization/phospho-acceptor domain-containing protein, partial [Anaerolineae bacterium]|nr:histidine kinase dimerization/phospho-acceptor domain-containing protein [Anaerolineae bacterium]